MASSVAGAFSHRCGPGGSAGGTLGMLWGNVDGPQVWCLLGDLEAGMGSGGGGGVFHGRCGPGYSEDKRRGP